MKTFVCGIAVLVLRCCAGFAGTMPSGEQASSVGRYQPAALYSEALTTSQYLTMRDGVRLAISIEICYTKQTIKALEKIKASPVLMLLPSHAVPNARFIVEQLQKWTKCKDEKISWMPVDEVKDFGHLLGNSRYDRILVSPGARGKVPIELLTVRAFYSCKWSWIRRIWKSPESVLV